MNAEPTTRTEPGASQEPELLRITDLSVTYPTGQRALDAVSLSIGRSRRLGLVGASGSGKTTLVQAILGLLPRGTVVAGRIEFDGIDVCAASPNQLRALRGRAIGYVAQDPFAACDPLRTVGHHLEQPWRSHRLRPPRQQVVQRLTTVGIDAAPDRIRQRPHQWSGGMLQRAGAVAAVAHAPALTLADEPTSALDTDLADDTLELIRALCAALVVVSHDLALVARHTEDVVVLDHGRVVETGPSARVLSLPSHPVTRALVRSAVPERLPRAAPRPSVGTVVRLREVSRSYPGADAPVSAVREVDLDVREGEVVGVVGRSGSGKSTLLRLIAGIERPDRGVVEFGGIAVWAGRRARPARPGWVMPVFQDPVASLDRRWPLWRIITEPLREPLTRHQRRERARAELAAVDLAEVDVDRTPGTLSVGQCQRVAVVRALIARPAVVIADEPTASLDVVSATLVCGLLRRAADAGAAVVVVSHDRPRLATYSDRIITMADGRLRGVEAGER